MRYEARDNSSGAAVCDGEDRDEVARALAAQGVDASTVTVRPVHVISADDVRAECQRRILAFMGVTTLEKCMLKQINAAARVAELAGKASAGVLSPQEVAEMAALQAQSEAIRAIRAASNAMEPAPPADFMADNRWPQ